MKKKIYSMLCIAFVLGACSNENTITDSPLPNEEARTVTFSLGAPGREPLTYAQVHEADEYAVNRLDIFQFNAAGELQKVYANVATTSAPNAGFPARKTVAQIVLPVGTTGNQDFLFVANANGKMQTDLAGLSAGTAKDDFVKQLTTELAATNAKLRPDLLMTGEKTVNIANSTPMDLTADGEIVMLTRAVARLDVGIRLKTTEESLTITKVELKNAPRFTTLYPATGNVSPTGSGKAVYEAISATTTPALATFFDNTPTANYTSRYKKLFYLYERDLTQYSAEGTPTVYVSADYKANSSAGVVKMRYEIPFDRSVVRNHLYTFILGVAPEGDIYVATAEIKTRKWEDEIVLPGHTVTLLGFTAKGGQSDFTYDNATHVMTLADGEAKTLTEAFTITSAYQDDDLILELLKSGGGIAEPNNDWIDATTSAGKVTVKVTENTEGAQREGVVWFKSKKDVGNNQLYAIKVVQPKK